MRTFTFFKVAFTSALFFFLFTVVSFAQKATLFENFEASVWGGNGYAQRIVTDDVGSWSVSGVGNMDDKDRKIGTRSIRLRGESGDNCHIQMNFDKIDGIGEASFYYASYGTHADGIIVLYYSVNGGASWTKGGEVKAPKWDGEMLKATFTLNISGIVRVKIVREGGLKQYTSVNIDDLNLTDFVCENCVKVPVFDPPGGICKSPVDVTITTATAGATIRYTLDETDPDGTSPVYSVPIHVSANTTIKAKAWKAGMEESSINSAIFYFPEDVGSLAELRALAPESNGEGKTPYTYTGNAVVTQIQNFGNVKYIQEGDCAIMIWDKDSNLTTKLHLGYLITDLTGTLTNFKGMLEFVPLKGKCKVLDIDQKVTPVNIEVTQLDNEHNNPIQARVITIDNVLIDREGQTDNFKYLWYYNLIQDGAKNDSVFYTDKKEADYVGKPIPTIATSITGVCIYKDGKNRIVMLDYANTVATKIADTNKSAIKLSPNPANNFVNIVTGSAMKLEVYNLLGTLIATDNLHEGQNVISVSNYSSGIYLMKMIDVNNGQTYVQKLVVK